MATKSLTDVPETTHEVMQAFETGRTADLDAAPAHEPIPGEYDRDTLTHREPGAMTGAFNGADTVSDGLEQTLDADTRHDRELEGGGDR